MSKTHQQKKIVALVLSGLLFAFVLPSATQVEAVNPEGLSGDFNNDGYADLAIGQPDDIFGISEGAVNVIYGSSNGLSDTAVPDQLWEEDDIFAGSGQAFDHFGYALAVGHFNNDGYSDLAIGIPDDDLGASDAGKVIVIYGGSNGLQLNSPGAQSFRQGAGGVDDTSESGDHFGTALAAGDFNGDGLDDLAIGVPFESTGPSENGAVNVLYGGTNGLVTTGPSDEFFSQTTIGGEPAESGDRFGFSLAAGDFNGDFEDDLVVGLPLENGPSGGVDEGAVNVVYGSTSGLLPVTLVQYFEQDSAAIEETAADFDRFGWSVAAGNFNGDGQDDVAIGVPYEDVVNDSIFDGGLVNVIYGSTIGLAADQTGTAKDDEAFWQNAPNVDEESFGSDLFGFSVTAGDFNGDGQDDLAIGVPHEDVSNDSILSAGLINVIYGSTVGLEPEQSGTVDDDEVIWQNAANVEDVSAQDDLFGISLVAGDYNGDNIADVVVGVPYEDIEGNPDQVEAGLVNVIYGSTVGLEPEQSGTGDDDQTWWEDKGAINGNSDPFDHFGFSLG